MCVLRFYFAMNFFFFIFVHLRVYMESSAGISGILLLFFTFSREYLGVWGIQQEKVFFRVQQEKVCFCVA